MIPATTSSSGPALLGRIRDVVGTGGPTLTLPTLVVDDQELGSRASGARIEDRALSWFSAHGFLGDRTRLGGAGYPSLFRALAGSPPWVEVEPEDSVIPLSAARRHELRPLYMWAAADDPDWRVAASRYSDEREETLKQAGIELHEATLAALRADLSLELAMDLAKVLGPTKFEHLLHAVFDDPDLDLHSPATGTPDLFVWRSADDKSKDQALCFFVEVKGPRDHLRRSQFEWLRRNWDIADGHVLLLTTT